MNKYLGKKQFVFYIVLICVLCFSAVYFYKKPSDKPSNDNLISLGESEDFNTAMREAQKAFGQKDYELSISYYNEALSYLKSDKAYAGLYTVYSALKNWDKVVESLDSALNLNPLNADYWVWKLYVLDEQKNASFSSLKSMYEDAMTKVDPRLRANLTVNFARIAENNKQYKVAIDLWVKAQELAPVQTEVYNQEIERLKSLLK